MCPTKTKTIFMQTEIMNFGAINTELVHKHYSYPSIEQFRNVIYNVNHKATYMGKDENGEPIYQKDKVKPKLVFRGTTKLHGTNASVIINVKTGLVYCQSRENIISPTKDNAGFATFIASIQQEFCEYIVSNVDAGDSDIIAVYGEWCGGSIQKGVALNGLEKMFVIFDIRLINSEADVRTWLSEEIVKNFKMTDKKVYNIYDFETWEIEIDFEYPQLSQNRLVEITTEIEHKCPVGAAFGSEGVGEGAVWKCITGDYAANSGFWMKVKGEKHSSSKVKTIAAVDTEKVNSVKEFVELAVTENRCQQGIDKLREAGKPLTRASLGDFLRWVHGDIVKEELDTIIKNGLEVKDISSHVSSKARQWFFDNEIKF